MKQLSILSLSVLGELLLLVTGCQPKQQPKDNNSLYFYAGRQTAELRVSENRWEAGDEIGLYVRPTTRGDWSISSVQHQNLHYRTSQGGATAAFAPDSEADKISWESRRTYEVLAYYPYSTSMVEGRIALSVADQKTLKPLLYSDNLTDTEESKYKMLSFRNAYSTLLFEIEGEGGTSLEGLMVQLKNFPLSGTFDLLSRTWTLSDLRGEINVPVETMGGKAMVTSLILPQSAVAGMEVLFTLPSGRTYRWPVRTSQTYEMGTRYSYKIKLKETGTPVVVENAGPIELPAARALPNIQLVQHMCPDNPTERNFYLYYDTKKHLAYYVAYPLYSDMMGSSGRTNAWGYDPDIAREFQPNLGRSYMGNYSRGHQIPSSDRTRSRVLNQTTFYYSNMAPQEQGLNGGVWRKLEDHLQVLAKQISGNPNDTLYVVTGIGFESDTPTTTTDNSGKVCPVPDYFYKAIAWQDKNQQWQTAAWKIPHVGYSSNYDVYRVSVVELEQATGFIYFPVLPTSVKANR